MRRTMLALSLATCLSACRGAALLSDVSVEPAAITPDRDGVADVARLAYVVGAPASVSIILAGPDGVDHVLRDRRARSPGHYEALFGGVVDGRMLGDGDYRVAFVASALDGSGAVTETRTLAVSGGDTTPPVLAGLTVTPATFTPNQDGIGDRVAISYRLDEAADVRVHLETAGGAYVTDILEDATSARSAGEPGPHVYDYDAGVDADAPPPPDGEYRVVATAEDRSGNVARATVPLHIRDAGQPRAALVGDVEWSATVVPLGDTLSFSVTVTNVGATPIRTRGPESGIVYDNDQTFNRTAPSEVIVFVRVGDFADARHVPADRARVDGVDFDLPSGTRPDAPSATPAPVAARPASEAFVSAGAPADDGGARVVGVCGAVRLDGAPAADVRVVAFEADGDNGIATTTGADGRYCFAELRVPPAPKRTFARSPGAVRLALEYDDKATDIEYPFRWQLGRTADLDACGGADALYLCLAPGRTVTVAGGVRFVDPPLRRSTAVYVALMHEDVRRMHGPYGRRTITVEH